MPPGVIQLDPVVIGDDEEERRRREAARAEASRILAGAGVPQALAGMQSDAQAVGDAYRADPANRHPEPFGSEAASAAGLDAQGNRRPSAGPSAPPAAPQRPAPTPSPAPFAAAPVQPAEPPVRQLEPVDPAVGYQAPQDAAPMPSPDLRAPHPDAEVYGSATDDEPELPGNVRPGGADPDAEIWGEATDADPVLPGRVAPGTPPSRSLGDPALNDPAPPPPSPAQQLDDPSPRAELERLLSARLAQRPSSPPSAQPAVAGATPAPDFTGADVSDAIRRPFHAIANALRAAAGRPSAPFRSERAQTEARIAREQAAEADRARQQDQLALARERLAMDAEDRAARRELEAERNAISREMQSGRLDVAQERADIARRAAELRAEGASEEEALRRARREALEFELGTARAMRDPASPESQSARAALFAELDTLRDEIGFDPPPAVRQMLEAANGEQIQRYRETLIRSGMLRPRTARRGGAGGGAGMSPEVRAALDAPPEGWTGSEDQWRALPLRDRRQVIERLGTRAPGRGAGGEGEGGTEILPGVHSPMDLPASEAQALRAGVADAAASAANIRELGTLHQRYGGLQSRINPSAQAEIVPRLTIARGMVATLGNTGVINPSEVPAINAALPDPSNLASMTFGTFGDRMRAWQSLLESRVRGQLAARGVDDAGINRVLATIRTGSWSQGGGRGQPQRSGGQRQQRPDTVRVRHPDGRTGTIPRANLRRALDAGFEEVR